MVDEKREELVVPGGEDVTTTMKEGKCRTNLPGDKIEEVEEEIGESGVV